MKKDKNTYTAPEIKVTISEQSFDYYLKHAYKKGLLK